MPADRKNEIVHAVAEVYDWIDSQISQNSTRGIKIFKADLASRQWKNSKTSVKCLTSPTAIPTCLLP